MSDEKQEPWIPQVPKRKKTANAEVKLEVEADEPSSIVPPELADEPTGPIVNGIVMARVSGGYMLIDVAIPEAELNRYATKIRPPEIYAIVRSQAEQRLDSLCEQQSNLRLSSLRTTGGMYTKPNALAALVEEIAVLAQQFWPGCDLETGSHMLEVFCRTGALPLRTLIDGPTGRDATGEDRERLQRLMHHAGGWPGVTLPPVVFGGGAT